MTTLFVISGLAACRSATGPLPPNAEPFEPPAVYARWWAMTEACSGRSGNLAAVRWYRAPGSAVLLNGEPVAAFWGSRGNRIVLAEEQVDNGAGVRHEMLHALLQQRGHPRAEFLEACASVLDCPGVCATDGGPWRPPRQDYVVLPPDSLDVDSEAKLLPPEADGQRWLAMQISVRNARDRAVVVAAPGDMVTPPTFAYDVRGPAGGISGADVASDSSTLFFRPHETKSRLFEFRVASELTPYRVPPGTHLVRGGYARLWAGYDTISVIP